MKQKGEITVFLTLMLSVLSAFIVTLTRTVRTYMSKSEAAYAADNAVRSCFAEYNRELFKRFHILLIDSSYKDTQSGPDNVSGHFSAYMENSLTENELCRCDISGYRNADDNNRKYLYDSAVKYAKENLCIDSRLSGSNDDAYFLTYLIYTFGNDDIWREGSSRRGEIEYMIYGYDSDDENVRWAHLDHIEAEDCSYEEYLIRRLEEESTLVLRQRFGDLITEHMRANGSPGFDLGDCYYEITFFALVRNRSKNEYNITRKYEYDLESI